MKAPWAKLLPLFIHVWLSSQGHQVYELRMSDSLRDGNPNPDIAWPLVETSSALIHVQCPHPSTHFLHG